MPACASAASAAAAEPAIPLSVERSVLRRWANAGIDPQLRGEQLRVEDFARIAEGLAVPA